MAWVMVFTEVTRLFLSSHIEYLIANTDAHKLHSGSGSLCYGFLVMRTISMTLLWISCYAHDSNDTLCRLCEKEDETVDHSGYSEDIWGCQSPDFSQGHFLYLTNSCVCFVFGHTHDVSSNIGRVSQSASQSVSL